MLLRVGLLLFCVFSETKVCPGVFVHQFHVTTALWKSQYLAGGKCVAMVTSQCPVDHTVRWRHSVTLFSVLHAVVYLIYLLLYS